MRKIIITLLMVLFASSAFAALHLTGEYPVCDTEANLEQLYDAVVAEDVPRMTELKEVCGMIPAELAVDFTVDVVERSKDGFLVCLLLTHDPTGNQLIVWTFDEGVVMDQMTILQGSE